MMPFSAPVIALSRSACEIATRSVLPWVSKPESTQSPAASGAFDAALSMRPRGSGMAVLEVGSDVCAAFWRAGAAVDAAALGAAEAAAAGFTPEVRGAPCGTPLRRTHALYDSTTRTT